MYAIIETGGKQHKVEAGDVLTVELIPADKTYVFDRVLLIGGADEVVVGRPYVAGAQVKADVLGDVRGPKSISFKYRRRKSSKRTHGHRQDLTKVKITEIVSR
jgi:large subunit ribosomal protein L21